MKVFLTGATGYVGSIVAEKLLEKRHEVLALVRNEEAEVKLKSRGFSTLRGELQDFDILKQGANEAEAVIHTAFSHNVDEYNDAVTLDRKVIKAFAESLERTNKPLIITSSSTILGETRSNEADEDYPFGENSPRKFRGESERDVLQLSSKGIRGIVLRLPLFVYGRGGSSFVPFVINQAKEIGSANYIESGEKKVSAVHVEDATDLYLLALETSTAKGLYNVSAEYVSLKELNEAVARLLNVKAKSISAEKAREQFGKMFDFLSINNQLDAAKARNQLGWRVNSNKTILEDIENGSYRKLLV